MNTIAAPQLSFLDAIELGLRNGFNFKGRASRREYWFFVLFQLWGVVTMLLLDFVTFKFFRVGGFYLLFALLVFIPSLAVTFRRLHDLGRSAWWFLLGIVPFGGLVLLYWYCQPSQPVANRFGPVPGSLVEEIPAPAPRLRSVPKMRVAAQSAWVP